MIDRPELRDAIAELLENHENPSEFGPDAWSEWCDSAADCLLERFDIRVRDAQPDRVTISPLPDTDALLIARNLRFDGPVTFDKNLAGEITGCHFDMDPLPGVPYIEIGASGVPQPESETP